MSDAPTIRVLHDPAGSGAENMARDEALLIGVEAQESPPTLRLYEWDPPTISLGYFQRFADYRAIPPPAGDLAVVRRLTGGGAILHDHELTYSLVLPAHHPWLGHGPQALYELMHDAIIAAVASLGVRAERCGTTDDSTPTRGPFFCFARRHGFDVLLAGQKLAGSAQRRTRRGILQHGSIVLENRFAQQPSATLSCPYAEALPQLRHELIAQLASLKGEVLHAGNWLDHELARAEELTAKYGSQEWTERM